MVEVDPTMLVAIIVIIVIGVMFMQPKPKKAPGKVFL